jgi:hypothetical protein
VYSPAGTVPLPSHLTSCTPTKSNLYLDSSLETVVREPALYKLLIFHVPNLLFIFRPLGRLSKAFLQVRGSLRILLRSLSLYSNGFSPNAQCERPPLVVCPPLLIQYIHSCSPQLEAVPPSATRDRTLLWCQGTHLTWIRIRRAVVTRDPLNLV